MLLMSHMILISLLIFRVSNFEKFKFHNFWVESDNRNNLQNSNFDFEFHHTEEISQNKAVTKISHLSFHAKISEITLKCKNIGICSKNKLK